MSSKVVVHYNPNTNFQTYAYQQQAALSNNSTPHSLVGPDLSYTSPTTYSSTSSTIHVHSGSLNGSDMAKRMGHLFGEGVETVYSSTKTVGAFTSNATNFIERADPYLQQLGVSEEAIGGVLEGLEIVGVGAAELGAAFSGVAEAYAAYKGAEVIADYTGVSGYIGDVFQDLNPFSDHFLKGISKEESQKDWDKIKHSEFVSNVTEIGHDFIAASHGDFKPGVADVGKLFNKGKELLGHAENAITGGGSIISGAEQLWDSLW